MWRRIKNAFLILLCSVILGTVLLVAVFCLPVDGARAHVEKSLYPMIEVKNDGNGSPVRKQIVSLKENFTDALMVQNALEKVEGQGPLAHAMYVYHHDLQDDTTWLTEESLITFLREGSSGLYLKEYSKYWHGYLVLLKPLLMCMTWEQTEIFLVIVQILLLLAVVAVSCYKRQPWLGLGILCAFLFMKPLRIWLSLAMCICWSIALAAVLIELILYEKIEKRNLREEFFLLIGIVTAYMDFLTYPIVTLGVSLCTYLVLHMERTMGWWKRFRQVFWMCACWAAGYIGMWGMKWVTAELTCQTGTLREAVWSVIYRTGPLDGYGSAFTGVPRTLEAVLGQYDNAFYTALFIALTAAALISALWCLRKSRNGDWGATMLCLAAVSLFPFAWLTLTQNHTAIHCVFTFRIMGVTAAALWCMTVCSVLTVRRGKRGNEGKQTKIS